MLLRDADEERGHRIHTTDADPRRAICVRSPELLERTVTRLCTERCTGTIHVHFAMAIQVLRKQIL